MRVIFEKTVEGHGEIGEIREVRDGFARNFLIPKGLATLATPARVTEIEAGLAKLKAEEAKETERAEALKKRIEKLTLSFDRESDEGHLHGTVTKSDLADRLEEELGQEIDRHEIEFESPSEAGETLATYRISPSVHATIKVVVTKKADVLEGTTKTV
jgi:large subunit ribosomal protein L9